MKLILRMNEMMPENCKDEDIPDFLYHIDGLDVAAGLKYCGDAEDYLFALKAFQERVAENAAVIEDYRLKKDIKNMTVKVHGVKSTSRAIGALELGDLAEKIENAGNEKDPDISDNDIERFLNDYRALGNTLSPVNEAPRHDTERPFLSSKELREILGLLKSHSENADYDNIEKIGEQLADSTVSPEESDYVHKICSAISELDYDELAELLEVAHDHPLRR